MIEPLECPECGGHDTNRVHSENLYDEIEEVYICEECPTEYVVKYHAYDVEVTHAE